MPAEQGLVRVDTNGRGYLVKMGPKQAAEYVAANPGSRIVGAPVPLSDEEAVAARGFEPEGDNLSRLTKAELVERAEALGLDTSGTKAELTERINAAGATPQE